MKLPESCPEVDAKSEQRNKKALEEAVSYDRIDTVQLLLDADADIGEFGTEKYHEILSMAMKNNSI